MPSGLPLKMIRIDAIVRGSVQGVGYRYFVIDRAEELGIVGYARNLPHGDVEVVAEGDRTSLESFIAVLKQGPYSASVSEVKVERTAATGEFSFFGIRR